MRGQSGGFSLIELMIVIVILGVLASMLVMRLTGKPDEARVTVAKTDMRTLESTLKFYKLDNYVYPTTEQGLQALLRKPESQPLPRNYPEGGYLESVELPKDPWGNEYIYRSPGEEKRPFEIISLGADGKEGGEGVEKDIRNWEK
jgi:general secretion pathway protein G